MHFERTNTESELWNLLQDPANAGPNHPATFVLDSLQRLREPWDYDLSLEVIRWLGTYLVPGSSQELPSPNECDIISILDNIFIYLPAIKLLPFLKEGKVVLEETLASVLAARFQPGDRTNLDKQAAWTRELGYRLKWLDHFIERATHDAKIEQANKGDDYGTGQRVYCPICEKRNDFLMGYTCGHFVCDVSDGCEFYWEGSDGGSTEFFEDISQLNRTINRPKHTNEVFAAILEEAPEEFKQLFQEVRENGASYWIDRNKLEYFYSEAGYIGTSCSIKDYFHPNPKTLMDSVWAEAQAALAWLGIKHPEILAKREYYNTCFFEDRYFYGYDESNDIEDDTEDEDNEDTQDY